MVCSNHHVARPIKHLGDRVCKCGRHSKRHLWRCAYLKRTNQRSKLVWSVMKKMVRRTREATTMEDSEGKNDVEFLVVPNSFVDEDCLEDVDGEEGETAKLTTEDEVTSKYALAVVPDAVDGWDGLNDVEGDEGEKTKLLGVDDKNSIDGQNVRALMVKNFDLNKLPEVEEVSTCEAYDFRTAAVRNIDLNKLPEELDEEDGDEESEMRKFIKSLLKIYVPSLF